VSLTIELTVANEPAPQNVYDAISQLEVEESSEQPGTLLLTLRARRTASGDLQFVGDGLFEPLTNITVTLAHEDPFRKQRTAQCVFDGYALSWRLHLGTRTSPASTIDILAQDASWLMNIDDQIVEWSGVTDGEIANAIFSKYGFAPSDANTDSDSARHTPETHTVLQRATDLQFLRGLARRGGKLCRVACTNVPGRRTGYFALPIVSGPPVATIRGGLNPYGITPLEFEWDVMRPTVVQASQVDLAGSSQTGTNVAASSSGLGALDARPYPAYLGRSSTLQLTAPADVPELTQRTKAVLIESGFFSRCTGEALTEEVGAILRVGDVVTIDGAGQLQSGHWLVWNVRYTFTPDPERRGRRASRMAFTLVRNAVGPSSRVNRALVSLAAALA